jgi:hypothetical protein
MLIRMQCTGVLVADIFSDPGINMITYTRSTQLSGSDNMTEASAEYIEHAMIMKTYLGYEGRGLLTALITLDVGPGGVQTFGGVRLSDGDELKKFVTSLLDVVGTGCWEGLREMHVRVKHSGGPRGKIIGIGHIVQERGIYQKSI